MARPAVAVAALAAALLLPAAPVLAEEVTNLGDTGAGSLRNAIATTPAGGTVTFAPALAGGTILLNSELLIDKSLTIDGPTDRRFVISGQNTTRVLRVSGAAADVAIDDLTIRDGRADGAAVPWGAGILFVAGHGLRLERVAVLSNAAVKTDLVTPFGGGIAAFGGHLVLVDSTIAGNTASDGSGGGVFVGSPATFDVTNSTIAGNEALGGGGIVSGNAEGTIASSTIARNNATGQPAGGLHASGPAVVTLARSLITENTASTAPNCLGTAAPDESVASGGGNVIASADCPFALTTGDVIGVAAPVGTLGDHGGPTPTIMPLAGPAIDAFACTGLDQRGVSRPQGAGCDAGAVELRSQLTVAGSLALGSAQVGQRTAPVSVVVTNDGEVDADLDSVALSGPNAAEVEPVADPDECTGATVLAPGASCRLVARLAPASAGAKQATYTVGLGGSSVTVAITGTGEAVPQPPADPPGGGSQPPPPSSAEAIVVGTSAKAAKGGKLKLRLRCATVNAARCAGSLTLKVGARKLTKGYSIAAGEQAVVTLKLGAGDRRRLAKKRSIRSAVTVVTLQPDGSRRTTHKGSLKLLRA